MGLVEKINATLTKLNIDLQLAKAEKTAPADSGATSGATLQPTSGGTLPSVIVTEYIPKNVSVSYSAIGAPVMETKDGGKEAPAEDGDYETVANKTITVKDGKLVAEVDTPQEDIDEHSGDTKTKLSAEVPKVEVPKEKPIELAVNKSDQLMSALQKAGVKLDKKGSYCLNIEVGEDGSITYGTLQTNTYENLLMAKESEIEVEIDKLTNAFETRLSADKVKYEKLIEAAMHGVVSSKDKGATSETKMSKTDILKMQIASKVQSEE